ncbi:MAG: hypothetical protein GY745_19470 [Actinomycetia bacterium]|nr:hypothetical protein [Actinomycetes bacterium]
MIRVVQGLGVMLVLLLAVASCATGKRPIVVEEGSPEHLAYVAEAETPVAGGVMRAALLRPHTVDPAAIALDHPGAVILSDLLFDGLTQVTAEGEVVGGLASRWDPSEDFTVWTFSLDDEASFHDGTPVTADLVVASLERLATSESGAASTLDPYSLEVVDAGTVRVSSESPDALVPLVFSGVAYGIVPADFDEETLVGSGPFRAVSVDGPRWRLDGVVGHTWIEGVEAILVDEPGTALDLFVSDTLDLAVVPSGSASRAFEAGVVHQRASSMVAFADSDEVGEEPLLAGLDVAVRPWSSLIPRTLVGEVPCLDCETPAPAMAATQLWVAPYPSPAPLFEQLALTDDGPLERLLALARGEPDPVARAELFARADEVVQESGVAAPVADGLHTLVVSERVQGLAVRADGSLDAAAIWLGT